MLNVTTLGDSGTRVVFCHGLFGQGRNWTAAGKALSAGNRVLLVDLPDHGKSGWSDHFDYLQTADQVADLLSAEDPAALVGHSMGGKVAMLLALRHPELVERLCVVDVAPVAYDHLAEFTRYVDAMRNLDLESLQSRADADAALADAVPNATVRGFLLQNLRRDGASWKWRLNLRVLGRDLADISGWPEERLTGAVPYDGAVLWVAGGRSRYVKAEHAAAMDRWFPRNRRVTVKGAGHWVHSEQPEVFLEVLRQFLSQPGASA